MIRSHRRAHLWIHFVLWPLAFVLLAAGIAGRRPVPLLGAWPSFLADPPAAAREILWSREDLFDGWPARVTARVDGSIDVKPLRPIDRPDLLLYWAAGAVSGTALPGDAHLLGRITGTTVQRIRLPDRLPDGPAEYGSLVVYSLGHQEIVATAILPSRSAGLPR